MTIQLTPTQQAILTHAHQHTEGKIAWFPENIKGGARQKVIDGLFKRDLITYDGKDIGRPGSYMFEPAGDIHQPRTTKGCILFCVFEGPIAGLDDDGVILGIVDGKTMRAMAEGHGSGAILDQTSV